MLILIMAIAVFSFSVADAQTITKKNQNTVG